MARSMDALWLSPTKLVDHSPLGDLVVGSANWASFLKKMLENAMIPEIAQEEKGTFHKKGCNKKSSAKLTHQSDDHLHTAHTSSNSIFLAVTSNFTIRKVRT